MVLRAPRRPDGNERDLGAVSLIDLLMGTLVTAILMGGLATVMLSAQRAATGASQRAVIGEQVAELDQVVRAVVGGSATPGACALREVPGDPAALANCRRLDGTDAVLASGSAERLCARVRPPAGVVGTGEPASEAALLGVPDERCLELTDGNRLLAIRTPGATGSDFVAATLDADPAANLVVVTGLLPDPDSGALFTYHDAAGAELEPSLPDGAAEGDPEVLTATQLAEVRTVRIAGEIEDGTARRAVVIEVAVGAGLYADEQRWQGR